MNRPSRRISRFIPILTWLALLVSLATGPVAPEAHAESVRLVILHVNDTHGRLRPFKTKTGESVGGITRLATLAEQVRQQNPGRTLLLHAGDVFSRGGPLTVYYGGEANMKAMERAGYDAFTPGNGEFYFATVNLLKHAAAVRFPTLLANVTQRGTGEPLFRSHVVMEKAGVRVGILGLGFVRTGHHAGTNLVLEDPVTAAKREVPALRQRVDLLVALTHIGHGTDRRLAAGVPELDIVIGGHSHTALRTPVRIPRANGTGEVVVVQAGGEGRFAGRLDVRMEKQDGRFLVGDVQGVLVPINADIPENESVRGVLDAYDEPLSSPVCDVDRTRTKDETRALLTEAMRAELRADVACLGQGGVKTGLTKGERTLADVCLIHPWRNRVLRVDVSAAELTVLASIEGLTVNGCRTEQAAGGPEWHVRGKRLEAGQTCSLVAGEYIVHNTPQLRSWAFRDAGVRLDTLLLQYLRRTMPVVAPVQ